MGQHFVPKRVYYSVFTALIALTGLTVWVSFMDLGAFNNIAAILIAATKALLVLIFFMHLKYGSKLIWAFVATGFLFLAILLTLTMVDSLTRDWYVVPKAWSSPVD